MIIIVNVEGMVGEADPDDDKDANASLQISILGIDSRFTVYNEIQMTHNFFTSGLKYILNILRYMN